MEALRKNWAAPPCLGAILLLCIAMSSRAQADDACETACVRLRDLAWRRLYSQEVRALRDSVSSASLQSKRESAKEPGARQACLSACRQGRVDTVCVMRSTDIGIDEQVIAQGAPACVKARNLVALFDASVLVEERSSPSGSCDASEVGVCVDFEKDAPFGAVGKGAACAVAKGGSLKKQPCPKKNLVGSCKLSAQKQTEHYVATGVSYQADPKGWAAMMKQGCEAMSGEWVDG